LYSGKKSDIIIKTNFIMRNELKTSANHGLIRDFVMLFGLLFIGYRFFIASAEEMMGQNIVDDPDQDGLTTAEERLYGTNPSERDTDGDGYTDGVEVRGGYDPIKKAPGDRIVADKSESAASIDTAGGKGGDNLTDMVSEKLATIVQNTETSADGTSEVALEELNSLAQEVSSGEPEEIILPEIDISTIKMKDQSYSGLSKSKRQERIREDVVEYLTTVSYIFANNSSKTFTTEDELKGISEGFADDAINAISMGNLSKIDSYVESGTKMLEQIKEVEVPEAMLETHVKALKLVTYLSQMKDEVGTSTEDDPIKAIKSLSRVQGLLNVMGAFAIEVQAKLAEYEITTIPLDL
jgi:hypothetical protein